jgi:hypothetical protein
MCYVCTVCIYYHNTFLCDSGFLFSNFIYLRDTYEYIYIYIVYARGRVSKYVTNGSKRAVMDVICCL